MKWKERKKDNKNERTVKRKRIMFVSVCVFVFTVVNIIVV